MLEANYDDVISIHALREESDCCLLLGQVFTFAFQSTLSVRRATMFASIAMVSFTIFQSTLSVRRATKVQSLSQLSFLISIHALREESDPVEYVIINSDNRFQSTLSVRRATKTAEMSYILMAHFNPRSP